VAIAVEPAACPSMTRGKYAFDFGDTGHLTPLVKMHTLGSEFIPPGFHAGGLRYHGMARSSTMACHCTGCLRMTASAFSLGVAVKKVVDK
jgi:tryptophan synthase beta chain